MEEIHYVYSTASCLWMVVKLFMVFVGHGFKGFWCLLVVMISVIVILFLVFGRLAVYWIRCCCPGWFCLSCFLFMLFVRCCHAGFSVCWFYCLDVIVMLVMLFVPCGYDHYGVYCLWGMLTTVMLFQ